ncbi:MAG: translocation/assembly module TamB domain-containing protein [Gemmatimonadota bacterium]
MAGPGKRGTGVNGRPGRLVARLGRGLGILLGFVLLALASGLLTLTQTRFGRNAVAAYLERKLERAFQAEVEIGPIVAGNLLTRAVLERFVIAETGGELFVQLDSVRLSYDPLAFLAGNFAFRRVSAGRGDLRLLQGADGSWNFDRIFATPEGEAPATTRVALYDFHVKEGRVVLRRPWAPELSGAVYDSAGTAAVAGEALWRVERTADGRFEQVVEAVSLRGGFPLLRLAHPGLPVTIRLREVAAELRAVQSPIRVLRFDGELVFRDTVSVEIRRARLPASRLSGSGWVAGDPTQYRIDLRADPASFSDLEWLPIPLPDEGGGPMRIALFSRGDLDLVQVEEGDVRVRDSHLQGSFTLGLGTVPRFERLELRARPLRLALLDEILERPSRIDGYVVGNLSGSGPVDGVRVRGRATLRDLEGEEAPSGVRAEGRIGIVEPHSVRGLRLQLEEFDPRWARVAGLSLEIGGRLRGRVDLEGDPRGGFGLGADLFHASPGSPTSHLVGSATVDRSSSELEIRVRADPLSLTLLGPYLPKLNLVGTVRGPISARGTPARLRANADLETPRGHLTFDGRFDLEAERQRYDAQVTARGIDLQQWAGEWPPTELAVTGRVEGEGTDPASLEAAFDLEILPSLFQEARVDTSVLRFRIARGLARVDTFAVRTDVATLHGRGGFGLSGERSGTLILDVEAPDLGRWNRWLVAGRSGAAPPEAPEDLFAGFPEAKAAVARAGQEPALPDTLTGRLDARGAVFGNLRAFSFGGRLAIRGGGYGPYAADSLHARLDVRDPRTLDSLVLNVVGWNAVARGLAVDSLSLRLERRGEGPSRVRFFAARDTSFEIASRAGLEWSERQRGAALEELRLRTAGHTLTLGRPATLVYGDSGLVVRDLLITGDHGEFLAVGGRIARRGPAELGLEFRNLHVAELLRSVPGAPELSGTLSGSLDVGGTARAPRMQGDLRVEQPGLGQITYPLLVGSARYADRKVTGELRLGEAGELLRARGELRADLALVDVERRLPEDAFDFRVRADSMPLKIVELLSSGLRRVEGGLRGEVRVNGKPGEPRLSGTAWLEGGEAWLPELGIRLRRVTGRATFQGSEARLDSVTLYSSEGGRAEVRGTVGLAHLRDPSLNLGISARQLQAIARRRMSFQASGEAKLTGTYRAPRLTGAVRLLNGEVREEEFLRTQTIVDLTDPDVYALIDTTVVSERRLLERVQNPFMRNLKLEMELAIGPDLWLRSDVLNVELEGEGLDLRMDRAAESIVGFGTVRLIRGRYVFDRFPPYRQSLQLAEGTLEFVGEPGLNPSLQIAAEYRTRTDQGPVTVRVLIGGTMRQTELTLESEPPLAESDQLCFLALGSPCVTATDVRQAERFVREGVLGTIGSGLSSALVGDVGLDYLTLRSTRPVGREIESQGFFSRGVLAGFAGTELEVGKYLGHDLFVTVAQPLGSRYPGWSIEWRFTPHWTLEARAENRFARRFGLTTGSSLEFDQTFGLFIFREWSF